MFKIPTVFRWGKLCPFDRICVPTIIFTSLLIMSFSIEFKLALFFVESLEINILFEPENFFPTSGVFRAGLASFTKLFVDQYSKYNVRMNNILPGFIDSLPEKKEFKKRIPLNRYGKVNEISEFISFLASDSGAYITGQNLRIDGGITKSV